jgi:hypothetical protein
MDFGKVHFGSIMIDGVTYVVIDRGEVFKRKKKASKQFREQFRHTPVSIEEKLPWNCRRLVVGTGKYGSLPVMDEVRSRKIAPHCHPVPCPLTPLTISRAPCAPWPPAG